MTNETLVDVISHEEGAERREVATWLDEQFDLDWAWSDEIRDFVTLPR